MAHPEAGLGAKRSSAVTALAVVNFILGGLRLLLSVLMLLLAGPFLLIGGLVAHQGPPEKPDMYGLNVLIHVLGAGMLGLGIVLLVLALVFILISVLLFVAGTGLLGRRPSARRLTLVLGGLGGLLAMLYLSQLASELLGAAPTSEGVVFSLVGLLVHGGYCALALAVLLNRRIAAEFV